MEKHLDKGIMEKNNWVAICRSPPCGFDNRTIGIVPHDKIHSVRWDYIGGGFRRDKPMTSRSYLYADVWCDELVQPVDHSCMHGPPPHKIKVCIVKKYTPKRLYNILHEQAKSWQPHNI